jgi:methyl-accepting chemotaxis protein
MTPIIDGLMNSLQGMSVAFVTSLCGIGGSIIVTLINMAFSIQGAKEQVLVCAEEYLDHSTGRKRVGGSAGQVDLGLDQFGDKLEENLKDLTSALSYRLGTVATEMANTAESLNGSISKFDESIQTFNENTRDFSEFNHELRTNIQRMNVTFDDFTAQMKSSTKELKTGHQVLSNTLEVIGQEKAK